ncbi:hypothetical protein C0991_011348 [Blastosporella zonata]|nr:hypothetical protein C0991_011348 [Blastosporella zonata]
MDLEQTTTGDELLMTGNGPINPAVSRRDAFEDDTTVVTAGFVARYANGMAFEPRDENFGNAHLYRRRNGSFYCVLDQGMPVMDIPEGLMKKFLMFDALVSDDGTKRQQGTYGMQARKNVHIDPTFHTVRNEVPKGVTVPSGFHDFARSMNADDRCLWGIVEYDAGSRVWTWPPAHHPRSRGPMEIVIDYPSDEEIRDLRDVINAFRDHETQRFSMDLLNRHVRAFQENVMLQMKVTKLEEGRPRHRRGGPYGGPRPTSRMERMPSGPSTPMSQPTTPFSHAMGQLNL